MVFFDDQHGNIRNVSELGVTCVLTPDGTSTCVCTSTCTGVTACGAVGCAPPRGRHRCRAKQSRAGRRRVAGRWPCRRVVGIVKGTGVPRVLRSVCAGCALFLFFCKRHGHQMHGFIAVWALHGAFVLAIPVQVSNASTLTRPCRSLLARNDGAPPRTSVVRAGRKDSAGPIGAQPLTLCTCGGHYAYSHCMGATEGVLAISPPLTNTASCSTHTAHAQRKLEKGGFVCFLLLRNRIQRKKTE